MTNNNEDQDKTVITQKTVISNTTSVTDKTIIANPNTVIGTSGKTQISTTQIAQSRARALAESMALAKQKSQSNKTHVQIGATPADGHAVMVGVGDTIKQRFILDRMLGEGGMGAVFRALDLRKKEAGDNKPYVALKLLNADFKTHSAALVTLQREARKTQELAHPNIVTVYDFDRDGDLIYITMEELSGKSLDRVIAELKPNTKNHKPLSQTEKLDIIKQIAQGLAYAHSKGIVHSDLKPANIFLTESGRIKILDFGIARAAATDTSSKKNARNRNKPSEQYQDTYDAGDLGAITFAYASLEMVNFDPPSPSDDIYALGIIACELLGGAHPYETQDAATALNLSIAPQLPKLSNPFLKKLLLSSIALERKDRVEDAGEFLKRLRFAETGIKRLSILAGVILIAAAGNFFYWQKFGTHQMKFSELPATAQQTFKQNLNEAKTALQFNDMQGAVVSIDQAFAIYKFDKELLALRNQILQLTKDNIAAAKDENSRQFYQSQLDQLHAYKAFVESK